MALGVAVLERVEVIERVCDLLGVEVLVGERLDDWDSEAELVGDVVTEVDGLVVCDRDPDVDCVGDTLELCKGGGGSVGWVGGASSLG